MGGEPEIVERVMRVGGAFVRILSGPRPASHTGPPFVLVHGIGTSHRYFARLHRELARNSEVHSVDLPGFGGMPKPDAAMEVRDMATALASVLDHLGTSSAVLVGHSMGAQWVVELAATRPDLAAAVVLIGPVADDARRTTLAQSAALVRDALREPLGANAIVFVDYARCGPAWFSTQLRWMIAYPIEDRVRTISAPLLVLRGGRDPIAGTEWCRKLRSAAPHGSFVVVPGNRHVVQHSAAPAVADAIRAFIARQPAVDVAEQRG